MRSMLFPATHAAGRVVRPIRAATALCIFAVAACACSSSPSSTASTDASPAESGDDSGIPPAKTVTVGSDPYEHVGSYPVGHTSFSVSDPTRSGRTLLVEAWYPADASAKSAADTGVALEDLEPAGPHHDALAPLMKSAPSCVRRRTQSAANAAPASGTYPVAIFSHCYGCMRFSSAQIAERLASHGIAVLAPDHTGNTIWDSLAGTITPLDGPGLATRAADVRLLLDVASGKATSTLPTSLTGKLDVTRAGVYGHSFGGATTGYVLELDDRFKAGLSIAAPFENGILPPTKMSDIHKPALFIVAVEDNSISEIGNGFIRNNFTLGNPPLFKLEVADAGHWSFSDIAGLTPKFAAGCGQGTRQTDGTDFTYLDNAGARGLAASYVAAYFGWQLAGDTHGHDFVRAAHPSDLVNASARE